MAGEWSKAIGEKGEEIVEFFLEELAGYPQPRKGIKIGHCNYPDKHKLKKDSQRTQHGIDFLISYKCPLVNELLEICSISSKYTENKYTANPKGKFKEHFEDLVYTLECVKNANEFNEINSYYSGVTETANTGVLFYLSGHQDDWYTDILSKIANSEFTGKDYDYEKVFVVDNFRLSFLYDAISYVKNNKKYFEHDIEFIFPDTGLNISPINSLNSGKQMPVQYFNTSVLPMRLSKDIGNGKIEVILYLALIDNFDEDYLRRMIGLAKRMNNMSVKTIIAFPDFVEDPKTRIASKVLQPFNDPTFTGNITVISYRPNFRNTKQ